MDKEKRNRRLLCTSIYKRYNWTGKKIIKKSYPVFLLNIFEFKITVPFGDAVIQTIEGSIGSEICEELWSPLA